MSSMDGGAKRAKIEPGNGGTEKKPSTTKRPPATVLPAGSQATAAESHIHKDGTVTYNSTTGLIRISDSCVFPAEDFACARIDAANSGAGERKVIVELKNPPRTAHAYSFFSTLVLRGLCDALRDVVVAKTAVCAKCGQRTAPPAQ